MATSLHLQHGSINSEKSDSAIQDLHPAVSVCRPCPTAAAAVAYRLWQKRLLDRRRRELLSAWDKAHKVHSFVYIQSLILYLLLYAQYMSYVFTVYIFMYVCLYIVTIILCIIVRTVYICMYPLKTEPASQVPAHVSFAAIVQRFLTSPD